MKWKDYAKGEKSPKPSTEPPTFQSLAEIGLAQSSPVEPGAKLFNSLRRYAAVHTAPDSSCQQTADGDHV